MLKLIQANKPFFLGYFIAFCTAAILFLCYSKEQLFFAVNGNYSNAGDIFFRYFTHFGDGLFFVAIILCGLFIKFRYSVYALLMYLTTSQVTQFFKRVVFKDEMRPKKYFEGIADIHFVDGVQVHNMMSFPSGHSTTAFAIALFLSLIVKNKNWSYVFLLLAFLAAYSRLYVAQHFFADVWVGSLVGVVIGTIIWVLTDRSSLAKKKWMNKSLLNLKG